jgi:hypothetical protein
MTIPHRALIVSLVLAGLCSAVQGQTKSVTAVSNVGAPALFGALFNRCPYDVSSGRLTLSAANSGDQFGIYTQVGALFSGLAPTGMVISTGKVADVKTGSKPSTAFNFTSVGDVHLQALVPGQNIADLARFEIDLSAAQDASISFSFVFASKEYNMGNSDVFGFWVNGVNLAQIRGQTVTTRNVNCGISGTNINGPNCDQYIYNVAQRGTSFPGYTKTQVFVANLRKGPNTIKIAIADTYSGPIDAENDSVVFLSITPGYTRSPTKRPIITPGPTRRPTKRPTMRPTMRPTKRPTKRPTMTPTKRPTMGPTMNPTMSPTVSPTKSPSSSPTRNPVNSPTNSPTRNPTNNPTNIPTPLTVPSPVSPPTF